MAGTYKFLGCTIKCLGYYEPEHRVIWEATEDATGEAVAHGYTLRECEFIIAEGKVKDERDQHWIGVLKNIQERLSNLLQSYDVSDDADDELSDIIDDIDAIEGSYKKEIVD